MADKDRTAAAANREYEDWPIEGKRHDEARYVGIAEGEGGGAWFCNEYDNELFESEIDESNGRLVPVGEDHDVSAGQSLGETVEQLGDELGWKSLSAFARDHLERDAESDTTSKLTGIGGP